MKWWAAPGVIRGSIAWFGFLSLFNLLLGVFLLLGLALKTDVELWSGLRGGHVKGKWIVDWGELLYFIVPLGVGVLKVGEAQFGSLSSLNLTIPSALGVIWCSQCSNICCCWFCREVRPALEHSLILVVANIFLRKSRMRKEVMNLNSLCLSKILKGMSWDSQKSHPRTVL